MPFSDPIADGPVIQRAGERALRAGTTLRKVLDIAREIRKRSEVPLLLFTYLNPVLRYGLEALATDAAACGIDGVCSRMLSVEEAGASVRVMRAAGLDTVFLAAPTSSPRTPATDRGIFERIRVSGFADRRHGRARFALRSGRRRWCERCAPVTKLPLAVGFGISTPEQVAEWGALAEAVVVGSASCT